MNVMFCMACHDPVVIVAFRVVNAHTIWCQLICPTCKEADRPFEGECQLDLMQFPHEGKPYKMDGPYL